MEEGKAAQLLMLLINDPHLFEHVRRITGCKRIGRFDGDVYRMMPGPEHEEPWHGEIFGHHMVEMSVDLSARPYSGGSARDSRSLLAGSPAQGCSTPSPGTRCSFGSLRPSSTGSRR